MMIPRIAVASFLSLLLAGLAWAIPSLEPLDRALDRADLVVVGKLGKLTPIEGTHQATGEIPVAQVLKGPADLKTVTLQTVAPGQQVVGPVFRHEGDEGIWILDKHAAAGGQARYLAIGPSNLQPLTALDEVKRILKEQGTLTQPPASQSAPATQPATAPATRASPAAVDPKTASLADALTDWIALLEKDDSKTATARWAMNAAVGDKMTAEWKGLRECHKQHDYRRWLENSSDEATTGLVPGGAKRIGKDTTFRVGGHGFKHLHIMWEKTHSGWRIARVLECY